MFTPYLNLTSLTLVSPEGLLVPPPYVCAEGGKNDRLGAAGGGVEIPQDGDRVPWVVGSAGRERKAGEGVMFCPLDEDAPDEERMARMGLERHVRVVR